MLEIKDSDIELAWVLACNDGVEMEGFVKELRKSRFFYDQACWFNYFNASSKFEEGTPGFEEVVTHFWNCFYFLLGTLYSANGKKIPLITFELLFEVFDESAEVTGDQPPYSLTAYVKEKLINLSFDWMESFEDLVAEAGSLFERSLLILAEVFLRAVELEKNEPQKPGKSRHLKLVEKSM